MDNEIRYKIKCHACQYLMADNKQIPNKCYDCDFTDSCHTTNNYGGFMSNMYLYEKEREFMKNRNKINIDYINLIGKTLLYSGIVYIAINVYKEYINEK